MSDFFIAGADTGPIYDWGDGFPAEDRCQLKSITPLEAAGILAALRGGDRMEMLNEFPLLSPKDGEEWIMGTPEDMASCLASLTDAQIPQVAETCAEFTAEELGWSGTDFQKLLTDLRALAQRATASGRKLFLAVSL